MQKAYGNTYNKKCKLFNWKFQIDKAYICNMHRIEEAKKDVIAINYENHSTSALLRPHFYTYP